MNYDVQMADYILPLLREYYRTITTCPQLIKDEYSIDGYPAILLWKELVYQMIQAFDFTYASRNDIFPVEEKKVAEGFENFGRYFRLIWI